jgi:hypothetical protein
MLIKIDHTVSSHISQDRGDCVDQLKRSHKMYSWVEGEIVGDTIDNFALANPNATFGDLIEWTKRTYMDRLKAMKNGAQFGAYKLQGDYNPTRPTHGTATPEFAKHGVSVIEDARLKPRKVAEPGQEAEVDAADANALAANEVDNPTIPPDVTDLPPIEPGQHPDASNDPMAAFKARKI